MSASVPWADRGMPHTVWGGTEDDGATVDDPSTVFEQAVAAYARGRFAIAVSRLWRLERAATVGRAVITAPAYFGEREIAATREAGRLAGFHIVRVLSEPTSAALAHGLGRVGGENAATVLVHDLGGSTFGVSILTLMPGMVDVLGADGDDLLGGTDFDSNLADRLQRRLRRAPRRRRPTGAAPPLMPVCARPVGRTTKKGP